MPLYDYKCSSCSNIEEITHSIKEDPIIKCSVCEKKMERMISNTSYLIIGGLKGSLEDHKENEHKKKVKDPERAVRLRKKHFGHDAVGDPSMSTDPRHVVKRGRTLGGQQKEIDRAEFIKAAAKDDAIVKTCQQALNKAT